MDWALIEESIRRTNRVLIVEETTRMSSLGAAIIEELQLRCFDWLDHEIMHTTGANMPPVVSRVLEELAFANQDNVISDLKTLVDSA
jgi:2-oxoisovalerate dehydrogenase E1 component